jgi:hypothetical protein
MVFISGGCAAGENDRREALCFPALRVRWQGLEAVLEIRKTFEKQMDHPG